MVGKADKVDRVGGGVGDHAASVGVGSAGGAAMAIVSDSAMASAGCDSVVIVIESAAVVASVGCGSVVIVLDSRVGLAAIVACVADGARRQSRPNPNLSSTQCGAVCPHTSTSSTNEPHQHCHHRCYHHD